MAVGQFNAVQDWIVQATSSVGPKLFENNAISYNFLKKSSKEFTDKGWKIPVWLSRPGGHTWFVPTASDFNMAVSPTSGAMYSFPTYYALPVVNSGDLLMSLKKGGDLAKVSLGEYLELFQTTAAKQINFMVQGDGSNALAYSASTLAATGAGQTMNCETTAHATQAGHTKGAIRLHLNNYYQAYDESTGNPRGTILVTTEGTTSCVVNVLWGSVTSGDPICDVGGFNKAMTGFPQLISNVSRVLQGLSTATYTKLNSPFLDLDGAQLTYAAFSNVKAQLQTVNNAEGSANNLNCVWTYGQDEVLRRSGYNYRMDTTNGKDAVRGVSSKYEDGDTTFLNDPDTDEDRGYLWKGQNLEMGELMPFGSYNLDGLEMRMQMGVNSTGSNNWQQAIGINANPMITDPRAATGWRRARINNVVSQVTSNAG